MKEIVLDTETTGISVKEGHRIVEIGCIELDNLIPTKNKFHCYLNPERKVSEKAFEVHGYSDEFLSQQKKFHEICQQFLDFVKGKKLIIHNAEFDLAHINNELSKIGKDNISNEIIDTLVLARDKFPGSQISLDALCKRYKIDNSKRVNHTALIDCDLLSKVYINLIDQKEPTLDFTNQDYEKKDYSKANLSYYKKVIKPSENELKNHREYLKNSLKKTLNILNKDGLILVVSFQSLEDRIVKDFFNHNSGKRWRSSRHYPELPDKLATQLKIITKKPILPSASEILENPRSRSAKLRVAQKI